MMGLLTNTRDANKPFHKAKIPYFLTKFLQAWCREVFFSACLVFRTQKGFVNIVAIVPAEPDDLIMLPREAASNLNNFLAWA